MDVFKKASLRFTMTWPFCIDCFIMNKKKYIDIAVEVALKAGDFAKKRKGKIKNVKSPKRKNSPSDEFCCHIRLVVLTISAFIESTSSRCNFSSLKNVIHTERSLKIRHISHSCTH